MKPTVTVPPPVEVSVPFKVARVGVTDVAAFVATVASVTGHALVSTVLSAPYDVPAEFIAYARKWYVVLHVSVGVELKEVTPNDPIVVMVVP